MKIVLIILLVIVLFGTGCNIEEDTVNDTDDDTEINHDVIIDLTESEIRIDKSDGAGWLR